MSASEEPDERYQLLPERLLHGREYTNKDKEKMLTSVLLGETAKKSLCIFTKGHKSAEKIYIGQFYFGAENRNRGNVESNK